MGSNKTTPDDTNDQVWQVFQPTKVDLYLERPTAVELETLCSSKDHQPVSPSDVRIKTEASREQWDKPIEFLLACISMSVGLGNIWRFPFVAYENGGGIFLIPYLIVLFLIGKPMYMLEMAVGQFSSKGQIKIWKMAPIFKGVGYGSIFGSGCVVTYYCYLMALTVFYFIQSFNSILPWSKCQGNWADSHNITCNENGTIAEGNVNNRSIPDLYFKINVIKEKDQIDDGIGMPDLTLSLCLLASWAVIWISLIKGVQSAGKVAYFTAIFPYVVLIILLIRGLTLEGAWDGVTNFFIPADGNWNQIFKPKVWAAAVEQCFFSLATGFGAIIMFSSYNPFSHNVYRDATIISLIDTFTSLLAGVTIFAILGNLSFTTGQDIKNVVKGGIGLAFVVYPDAIAKFGYSPFPQVFAFLFFFMLFTLGVGSATSVSNAIITVIHDQWANIEKKWITTAVCIVGFLAGLMYVTPGGLWMLQLVDFFGVGFIIYTMSILEMVGICWVYGLSNVVRDIEFMLKRKISLYWKFCWGLFIPVMLVAILVYSLATSNGVKYGGKPYPQIAIAFGWTLSAIAISLFPLAALHSIWTRKTRTICEKVKEAFRPSADWGPNEINDREGWLRHPYKNKTSTIFKQIVHRIPILLRLRK